MLVDLIGNSKKLKPCYYGNHRIILFHINSDLAALYEESDNTSQNISNPSTEINNAFGIFTGTNSDTLNLQVEPQ